MLLITLAIGLDLLIGDPRSLPHPVVFIGRIISFLEKRWNHGSSTQRKRRGFLLTATVVMSVWGISWAALVLLAAIHPWLGIAAELWLLASTLAIKGLADAGRAVAAPLMQGDLPGARRALSMIVGRDTAELDEAEITRGTVETVAENTVDGITAPLFFAVVGGAPLALAYKATNTLDSMVGYRNERYKDFGFASAKLDDIANWLPARLTALCLWIGGVILATMGNRPLRWRGALRATCHEAPRHPSPNAGWPETMVARLLGVQLGGVNTYQGVISRRATLGEPFEPLGVAHIGATISLMHMGWLLFTGLMGVIWVLLT
ncbi:adenosylcobinamide-phosphate synthase CbiB [Vreelandella nanhaiensis]|uniref:Cobalamin biosynthesis protein CobD n=1 Tax=Vreelandella nanhaiensis TaxID=1258546 RepID=A0A433KM36_9GAMM|nr:adenosylcobinamide-phosphate synthase CbiB [Halomonas nanhaiensis]RUR30662.1 cobalamin biosynthesis protein CobD [Halomonas nanhaiensis]